MQVFKVGGFVRDTLLGVTPKDCDYVAVGFTENDFLNMGYQRVGADFPVFLHPVTGDEYALARTERKTGRGYNGFSTDHGSDVVINGIKVNDTLNAELLKNFMDSGFKLDVDYSLDTLIEFFRNINQ